MTRRPREAESCTGKVPMNKLTAKEVTRRLNERGERVSPYRCTYCGRWHVGSQLGGPDLKRRQQKREERERRYG